MSCDWESDTDIPPPSAMVALEVDVAIGEISRLLQGSHRLQRQLSRGQLSRGLVLSSACP